MQKRLKQIQAILENAGNHPLKSEIIALNEIETIQVELMYLRDEIVPYLQQNGLKWFITPFGSYLRLTIHF